jgi:hypothetical protein
VGEAAVGVGEVPRLLHHPRRRSGGTTEVVGVDGELPVRPEVVSRRTAELRRRRLRGDEPDVPRARHLGDGTLRRARETAGPRAAEDGGLLDRADEVLEGVGGAAVEDGVVEQVPGLAEVPVEGGCGARWCG